MDERQQSIPTDEVGERELEDAALAFSEDEGNPEEAAADMQAEMSRTAKEETAKKYQDILIALGFKRYDDDDGINFNIRILITKIGVKFNSENPTGKVWAYTLTEDNKKKFIKNGDLKQLPLVQRYLDIQAGEKSIPEAIVTGRIIERIGKGIKVEFEEDEEKKQIFFGLGAIKKHDDGHHFIPHGFSKPSSDNPEGKMDVPRDVLLPELDMQPKHAPNLTSEAVDQKSRNENEAVEAKIAIEAQKMREEQGRVPAATTIPVPVAEAAPTQPPAAKPTVPELIAKYTDMLALVTEAINAEERIPEREKGYGIKFVFYSVRGAMENGGSQEEV